MKNTALDVIIIGAGLSGLCLAYFLKNRNYRIKILEGRSRIGGRILTTFEKETSIEMGATWFSPQHTELQKLKYDQRLLVGVSDYEDIDVINKQKA